MQVIIYTTVDGIRTLKNSEMVHIYRQLEGANLLKHLGKNMNSSSKFLLSFKMAFYTLVVIKEKDRLAMVVWLSPIDRGVMHYHFVIMPEFRGQSVEIGKKANKLIMEVLKLKMLIGYTPETNKLAIRWLDRSGYKRLGVVPNMFDGGVSGIISCYGGE